MQSLNLENVKSLDIKNTKTLTIVIIFVLVCFACIYVWQNKINIEEGFAQLYSIGTGDIVTLSSLDTVLVGSGNPISLTNTINSLIDARIATSQQAVTSRMPNALAPISQSNILSLVGVINGCPIHDHIISGRNNIDGGFLILGLNNDNGNKIIASTNHFIENKRFRDAHPNYTSDKSIICVFDWVNDNNIYYSANINTNKTVKNIIYTNVYPYPIDTDTNKKLISPFNSSTFKPGATYLFNIFHTRFNSEYSATFYILYNKNRSNMPIDTDVHFVNTFRESDQTRRNGKTDSFVVQTTDQTTNIGIYSINAHARSNHAYGAHNVDRDDGLSVTVYQVLNPSPPAPAITGAQAS